MTALNPNTGENFAQLLEESLASTKSFEGSVVKGRVPGLRFYVFQ